MRHMRLPMCAAALLLLCLPTPAADGPVGLSLAQVSRGSIAAIPLTASHPVHGQPSVSGTSADGTLILEVVGPPADISRATLCVLLTKGAADSRSGHALAQFMANVSPGWPGARTWLLSSVQAAMKKPKTYIATVHGNRQYEVYRATQPDGFLLIVKHR